MKFLFGLLFSFSAFAAVPGYEIAFEIEGKAVTKTAGKIRIKEGETGAISYKGTELQVTSKEGEVQGHKGIMVGFVVKQKKDVISTPQLLVDEKEEAQISIDDAISLKVSATRISL
ncbi:hypothetical protein [Peredibacter starrii]|uniref:Uncharacterized protein n=1 Tax=Peredibacter starrii TaxID=28202 RepID=A0AAX4HUZ5_9BACT|nr:hypothetical protein [Peredibacter starrii]WPU67087.1 hypothetical protein SOO65_10010 [Peredibacter starrii]